MRASYFGFFHRYLTSLGEWSFRKILRWRSGFRLRAPATLTPAQRLNFGFFHRYLTSLGEWSAKDLSRKKRQDEGTQGLKARKFWKLCGTTESRALTRIADGEEVGGRGWFVLRSRPHNGSAFEFSADT